MTWGEAHGPRCTCPRTSIGIAHHETCPQVTRPRRYDLAPAHPVIVDGETVAWAISAQWATQLAAAVLVTRMQRL